MAENDDRLELAVAAALEASVIPRQLFLGEGLVVDWKSDDTPVTRGVPLEDVAWLERLLRSLSRGDRTSRRDGGTGDAYLG